MAALSKWHPTRLCGNALGSVGQTVPTEAVRSPPLAILLPNDYERRSGKIDGYSLFMNAATPERLKN